MGTLCYTLLVLLVTCCSLDLVKSKHLPDVEFISQLKANENSELKLHIKEFKESGITEDYFRQTYGNIPIGDPLENYNVDIGAPLNEVDIAYNNSFHEGSNGASRDDLGDDPITLAGLYQGDIIIKSRDELKDLTSVALRSAVTYNQRLWPNGIIAYTVDSAFGDGERSEIAKAMVAFQKQTCLTFVPKEGHSDYIHVYKGQGCSSAVGRQFGRQSVSLGNGCVNFGTILHEFMHAAGFWHEQSRYDRDDHVTIDWDNIIEGLSYNFDKNNQGATTNLGLSYDYNSLMHYGSNAFAKDRRYPTIIPKQQGANIGNRKDFSKFDIAGLNRLYKCKNTPSPSPKPTTTTSKPIPETHCRDKHSNCEKWSSYGYCDTYSTYMNKNCKKSCNTCDSIKCADIHQYCSTWASQNQCQRNPQYMHKYCKKSCQVCG